MTVNAFALKLYPNHQHVQCLMQEEQEERLHAQRMPGGLQDAELALEIRASLLDAAPWAPQVLLIPCSTTHTHTTAFLVLHAEATLPSCLGLMSPVGAEGRIQSSCQAEILLDAACPWLLVYAAEVLAGAASIEQHLECMAGVCFRGM